MAGMGAVCFDAVGGMRGFISDRRGYICILSLMVISMREGRVRSRGILRRR